MLTREIVRYLSSILILMTGITLFILWIIAAHDKGTDDGGYSCHGCNYLYHEAADAGSLGYSSDLTDWLKINRDPFGIMVAFGVIIGATWMITSAIGFFAATKYMAWVYLFLGVFAYILLAVLFPIIIERIQYVLSSCSVLWATRCKADPEWRVRHMWDSLEQFWGISLVGFVIGAFQIASAAYLIHENEEPVLASPAPVVVQSNKP